MQLIMVAYIPVEVNRSQERDHCTRMTSIIEEKQLYMRRQVEVPQNVQSSNSGNCESKVFFYVLGMNPC